MNISFFRKKQNILFLSIIISFVTIIHNEEVKYNYSSILSHEPKVTVDFIFDENYKEKSESYTSQSDTFDKYFFTYYETELPLYNGAKMACYIPNKKQLLTLEENEEKNKTLIYNLSLDYGYIYLRDVNSLCFTSLIERWYYQICPSKKAIQTLSYNKIDEKTGKEVIEINNLGYSKNYTHLLNEYQIFNKETGFKLKKENENQFRNIIAINNKVVKIFDNEVLNEFAKNSKNILIVSYQIPDLLLTKRKDLKINPSKLKNVTIEEFVKKNKNFRSVELQRVMLKKLNKNTFLLDEPLPEDVKYGSIKIINQAGKDLTYENDIFVYKDVLYCNTCNFPKCEYNQCYVSASTSEVRKIIQILEENLVLLDDLFPGTFEQTKYALWYGNDFKISYGKGVITDTLNTNIQGSFVLDSQKYKKGDYIILFKKEIKKRKKKITNLIAFKNIFNNTKYFTCEIQRFEKYSIKIDPLCIKNFNEIDMAKNYLIVSKMNTQFKNRILSKYIDPLYKISKVNINNLNKISIPFSRDTIYYYETISPIEFDVHFTLSIINKIKPSYISLYLTSNKDEVNPNDYEIIFNAKSGILIKSIKDDQIITFYTNERMNLFTTKLQCDIILVNSTIYISTLDNEYEKLSSIKIKYNLNSTNTKINYIKINEKESSNLKFLNIFFQDKITNEHKINIFLYEKKYFFADNITFIDYFEGGDYCEAIKANRKVKVIYSCDPTGINSIYVKNVIEDEKKLCEYTYYVQSKYLCNPNVIMKNVIKSADNPVNCIPKNDKYNHNSEDFFK